MDLQDLFPALDVGPSHVDLTVKPSGTQQRGIQDILPVGGRHHHYTLIVSKTVHLNQQLIQGLFPLIMTAAKAGSPLTAHSVNLIDKDNGRGILFGLVKQIANAGGADTYIELHKV